MTLWGEGTSPEAGKSLSPSASPMVSNGGATGAAGSLASSGNLDLEAGDGQAVRSGSKLPFNPLSLSFTDVKYSVPYPKVRALPCCASACHAALTGTAPALAVRLARPTNHGALPLPSLVYD